MIGPARQFGKSATVLTAIGALFCALALPPALKADPRPPRPGTGTANPSALVAAEIAFNRLAREKGQWTAFRKTADDQAVMFDPDAVSAEEWLRGRADPPAAITWEPYEVWMSCDGTLGVTQGGWRKPDGTMGYYSTVWKRQKKGDYRWLIDQDYRPAAPLEKPDFLSATVADCPAPQLWKPRGDKDEDKELLVAISPAAGAGASRDGSLQWSYAVADNHSRTLTITLTRNGEPLVREFRAGPPSES